MISISHFTFNDFLENTYVAWDESRECIIIDPGCYYPNEKDDLDKFIQGKNLRPVLLINTHCHIDHVLGNRWVTEKYSIDLAIHKNELVVLNTAPNVAKMYGIFLESSPMPSRFFDEGEKVLFGNSSLDVLFTPGHSPGSISFYSENDKFIIGGDVLFQSSIGRTDLPGGDYEVLMECIFNKFLPLDDDITVYSGHGPSTTIGEERRNNPFILEYEEMKR